MFLNSRDDFKKYLSKSKKPPDKKSTTFAPTEGIKAFGAS